MTARMRTIDGALSQLKHDDPQTSLTRHALRTMILSGKVPFVRAGQKYLLNYDGLLAALAGEVVPSVALTANGTIRPISE